ncbi:MAG TPA: hypothetical protein VG815_11960 [Chloroflexota bacterium]|jgi:Mrp family chromosome partitioning ATPase|nr:hypothetical protein [Chloroflexota bacterium]
MELSDYGRVLKRWSLLIGAGTLLGLVIGGGIWYTSKQQSATPNYRGTWRVVLNYAAPTYVPGASIGAAANSLVQFVHDPAALQPDPRLPAPAGVKSVDASVDPASSQVTVIVVATTAAEAQAAAKLAAQYLVKIQNAKVTAAAAPGIRYYQRLVAYDLKQWHHYLTRYTLLNGPPRRASLVQVAGVLARSDRWQVQFTQDRSSLDGSLNPGEQAAQSLPGNPSTVVRTKALSPTKTIIPAAVIGLALSFLLAALLESRGSALPDAPAALVLSKLSVRRRRDAPVLAPEADSSPATPDAVVVDGPVGPRNGVLAGLADSMSQTADLVSSLVSSTRPSLFVTSPTRSKTKSDTAVGLAAALSRGGKRVVLIDADPAGEVTRFFGLTRRPGLSDYLGYPHGSVSQLVYRTAAEGMGNFGVLPYGIRTSASAVLVPDAPQEGDVEAWASGLAELATGADIVVVNGTSVLETPELVAPAATMGGAIVVLQPNREGLAEACDALRAHGVRLLGMVTNPGTATMNGHASARKAPVEPAPSVAEEVGAGVSDHS